MAAKNGSTGNSNGSGKPAAVTPQQMADLQWLLDRPAFTIRRVDRTRHADGFLAKARLSNRPAGPKDALLIYAQDRDGTVGIVVDVVKHMKAGGNIWAAIFDGCAQARQKWPRRGRKDADRTRKLDVSGPDALGDVRKGGEVARNRREQQLAGEWI